MRICIEVKDNKAQRFRLFVEFLRHWFSNRKLKRRFAALKRIADSPVLGSCPCRRTQLLTRSPVLKIDPDHWHGLVQAAQAAAATGPLDAALEPLGNRHRPG